MNIPTFQPFRKALVLFLLVCFLLGGPGSLTPVRAQENSVCSASGGTSIAFPLDGINLDVCSPLDAGEVSYSTEDNIIQSASMISPGLGARFSLLAVPYGVRPVTEQLPEAAAGGLETYTQKLYSLRQDAGNNPQPAPSAWLFGQEVSGSWSLITPPAPLAPFMVVEWVGEFGDRLWVARISLDLGDKVEEKTGALLDALEAIPLKISTTSTDLTSASKRYAREEAARERPVIVEPSVDTLDSLPTPSWWSGDCDTNNYKAEAGVAAYALGGSYRGVKACGPRPNSDSAPNVVVQFYSGAHGELEWQCVELSMRYLWLAYQIAPYSANGNMVVWNYSGSKLSKVTNGTVGQAPQAGDVLSYGKDTTWGHTSVVSASNVNSSGDGTITVIEQNSSASGVKTLTVTDWVVTAYTSVDGWLHAGLVAPSLTSPADAAAFSSANTITFSWGVVSSATGYKILVCDKDAGTCATGSGAVVASTTLSGNSSTSWSIAASSLGYGEFVWQVASTGSSGTTDFSAQRSFTVSNSAQAQVITVDPTRTPAGNTVCGAGWYLTDTGGYLAINKPAASSTHSAVWTATLPTPGKYKVEAYIVSHKSFTWSCADPYISKYLAWDTSDARYTVYASSGNAVVTGNQAPVSDDWMSLGTYYFKAGSANRVKLTDVTGETAYTKSVSFHQVRFTLLEATCDVTSAGVKRLGVLCADRNYYVPLMKQ